MSAQAKPQPTVPKQIGRYEIVRVLGTGCMGQVFLGHDADELRVAVKVVNPALVKKHDWAGRLQTDIDHPNVMKYREIPFDPKYQFFVVTDYLDVVPATFEPLRSRTFEEIVELYAKAAEALAFLEGKGILHGNVKPSNILCRRTKTEYYPIISDTGLRYVHDPAHLQGEVAARIWPYMAPEHIDAFAAQPRGDQPASSAGDVYSLAVSLVEALTGSTPFRLHVADPADPKQVAEAKRRKKYRIIFKNDASAPLDPKRMDEALGRALDPAPEKRPAMRDMAALLRDTIDAAKLAALSK